MEIRGTDRTYKVIALARRVANKRKAEEISTADILYGLAMEGSGIAANVLKNLDVELAKPARIKWSQERVQEILDSLTGEARALMERAKAEGEACFERWPDRRHPGFAWTGTEHVLLGLTTGDKESGTELLSQRLAESGLSLVDVRRTVLELLGYSGDSPD